MSERRCINPLLFQKWSLWVVFSLAPVCAYGQIGSIDAPNFQDVVSGNTVLGGWAMDAYAVITKIEILVDGTDFGSSPGGGYRADACTAIGNYPGCPYVGWSRYFDTTVIPDGPHMLTVVMTTSDNRQSSMIQAFIVDNSHQGLNGDTYYRIQSRATGGVLDDANFDTAAGAILWQWQFSAGSNQLWKVIPTDDGYWTFESLNSSKVLTVPFGQSANGTAVEQYEDYLSPYQEWAMVGAGETSYALFNRATGKSLDLRGSSPDNGTPIQIYDYLANPNQNWRIVPQVSLPQGLLGSGGSEGVGDPTPSFPVDDLLFTEETPGAAMSFATQANGPVCMSTGELASLPIAQTYPDVSGINDLRYAYTNTSGVRRIRPDDAVKKAFGNAFDSWNQHTSTTFVRFDPLTSGTAVTSASVRIAKGNNDQADFCAQFRGDRNTIFYADQFVHVARTSQNQPPPTIAQGQAAHEIGHVLGLDEATSNPGSPTVMNQASGASKAELCENPMGAPTRSPTPQDASTVNSCVARSRASIMNGSYGGITVYSTIDYNSDYGCNYIFNQIGWLYDEEFSAYGYPVASVSCN